MDDDKLRTTHSEPPLEVDNPSDTVDNDVILIKSTVPEVVVSDSSGNSSTFFENISAIEKDLDVSSSVDSLLHLAAENKSGEESCDNFVVLDDDDGHSSEPVPNKEIKQEQLDYSSIDIKEDELSEEEEFSVKSESKVGIKAEGVIKLKLEKLTTKIEISTTENTKLPEVKDFKIKKAIKSDVAICKSENLQTSILSSDSNLEANTCDSNSTISHTSALRPSLSSNETFVLQLNTTDALDSYLDKTSSDQSCNTESKDKEDCLKKSMEENDSKQCIVTMIPTKVPEQDSLILTADEELETEMSLAVKVKNDKNKKNIDLNKPVEADSKKSDVDDQAVLKTVDNTASNEKPISKTAIGLDVDAKKNMANTNDNSDPKAENDRLVSLPSDKIVNKNDLKKGSVSATNGKKSDSSRILWVSNVTHSVKATDLKQYISKVGKVVTAKVVTDGKKCYGYVVMENPEYANECMKTLNNAYFEGKKISLSFTRPTKSSSADKNPEASKSENDRPNSQKADAVRVNTCNATDDVKISKSNKDIQSSKRTEKRRRSSSKSRSIRSTKRRCSDDPLTTRFRSRTRERREYKRKSRSADRYDYRENLREKLERDRLKRKLMEEQRRNRDEMMRRVQREEKQRELEFKLEQERKKLQLERELFERERRELLRLDAERRKIEKERMEVLHQRTKLEEEYQKSRMKRKADEFNLSSTIVKPQEVVKTYDKRKDVSKLINNDDNYGKFSNSKHEFQKSSSNIIGDRKTANEAKNRVPSNHRNVPKPDRNDFKSGRDNRNSSKLSKREDFKSYDRTAPPPPKLNDFDDLAGRKMKHSDHKHEYSEAKIHGDRKPERGGRKIEVIDRKYYAERPNDDTDRKHMYRKPEFEERKVHSFPDRKYENSREMKRYREDGYPDRDNPQRTPWPGPVSYNDPWKPSIPSAVTTPNPVRYQDGNFSSAPYGGGPRMPPYYYHPTPPAQEYPRYDHCAQATGRKY